MGRFDLFLFADPHYFRFLIFKFSFLGEFDLFLFADFLLTSQSASCILKKIKENEFYDK